jgi:hypothetical protein
MDTSRQSVLSLILTDRDKASNITFVSCAEGESNKIMSYDDVLIRIGFGRYQLFTSAIFIMIFMCNSYI